MSRKYGYRWKQERAPLSNYEALCVTYELLILMYQEDIRDLEKKLKAVRHKVEKQKTKQGEGM